MKTNATFSVKNFFASVLLLCFISALLSASVFYASKWIVNYVTVNDDDDDDESPLEDKCDFIYLDVGTNVGIEIRKLFEPHLYNKSDVLEVFDTYFGAYE